MSYFCLCFILLFFFSLKEVRFFIKSLKLRQGLKAGQIEPCLLDGT